MFLDSQMSPPYVFHATGWSSRAYKNRYMHTHTSMLTNTILHRICCYCGQHKPNPNFHLSNYYFVPYALCLI